MQTATIIPDRLSAITTIDQGRHADVSKGMSAMEAVSYIAGERWSDHPACACPVISTFIRTWNDSLDQEDRNRLLLPLIPRLVGSRSTKQIEHRRTLMAADWLVRTHTPAWLRLAGLTAQADALSNLSEISSMAQRLSIEELLQAIRKDATADRGSSWDASGNAPGQAAWIAAGDAAGATVSAVFKAAVDTAVGAALKPTVTRLKASGVALIERMLEIGRAA